MAKDGVVKLRRGEREVWRGAYWVLTTEGIERYRNLRKWLPFGVGGAMKGWGADPLVPDAVLMCWYARQPEAVADINEWIALWRETCRLRGVSTQHFERLEAIARRITPTASSGMSRGSAVRRCSSRLQARRSRRSWTRRATSLNTCSLRHKGARQLPRPAP